MVEFKQFTYTNIGTEIEFMQGLIDLICGLCDGITCEDADGNPTTAADQYADLTSAGQAKFVFNFGNGIKLTLMRWYTNDQNCSLYRIMDTPHTSNELYYGTSAGVMTEATRQFFIAYIKSDTLGALWLGQNNTTSIGAVRTSILKINTTSDTFVSRVSGASVMSGTFVGSNLSATFSAMPPYAVEAGHIDYINSATFVSTGVKQFDTKEICSCSTVPQFASIALPDGRNFFTIATNAMVEIDPTA